MELLAFSRPINRMLPNFFPRTTSWHSKHLFLMVILNERAVGYTNRRFSSGKTSNRHFWPHIHVHIHVHVHTCKPNITLLRIHAQGNNLCNTVVCLHVPLCKEHHGSSEKVAPQFFIIKLRNCTIKLHAQSKTYNSQK